jgi:hypothetical protein
MLPFAVCGEAGFVLTQGRELAAVARLIEGSDSATDLSSGPCGAFAPAGTPPEVVSRINGDLDALLGDTAIRELLARLMSPTLLDDLVAANRILAEHDARLGKALARAKAERR